MTRCGYICCYIGLILAAAALVGGYVALERKQQETKKARGRRAGEGTGPCGEGRRAEGTDAPEAGAVAFRQGEERIVRCKAWVDIRQLCFAGYWGENQTPEEREKGIRYAKQELAAVLAEQALAGGGIVFRQEGGKLRAEMTTVTGMDGNRREAKREQVRAPFPALTETGEAEWSEFRLTTKEKDSERE